MDYHSVLASSSNRLLAQMTLDELHSFLTSEFELVPDLSERGNGRSYFWREVVWAPASTTRILRLHHDLDGVVTLMKLSVSSDNNNSVFISPPFDAEVMRAVIAEEIAMFRRETSRGNSAA
jgi:hypothetical protein